MPGHLGLPCTLTCRAAPRLRVQCGVELALEGSELAELRAVQVHPVASPSASWNAFTWSVTEPSNSSRVSVTRERTVSSAGAPETEERILILPMRMFRTRRRCAAGVAEELKDEHDAAGATDAGRAAAAIGLSTVAVVETRGGADVVSRTQSAAASAFTAVVAGNGSSLTLRAGEPARGPGSGGVRFRPRELLIGA